jgi:hypothetical protein
VSRRIGANTGEAPSHMEARAIHEVKPFAAAEEKFEELKAKLESEGARRMSHSDLERMLEQEGRELLRQMFQAHLAVRGPGEVAEPVVGADEVERPCVRLHERKLATLFGTVDLARAGYGAPGVESLHPLDAVLNLPDERHSLEIRRRVAEAAAKGSFEEAARALTRATGAPVAKRQAEQLAARAAVDFDAFYAVRKQSPNVDAATATGSVVVLTSDGKGVVMRQEDLREPTKKAAQARVQKLSKRLSKGEKKNAKRMATVAAAYTLAPFVRSPEDIVRDFAPVRATGVIRPKPEGKRVWASLEKGPRAVIEEAMYEALHRDPCLVKTWVALVDGNETQLTILRELSRKHGVELTVVVDLIHVLEYLWAASYAFNPEGSPEAQRWVTERLLALLRGKSSDVAAGIRRSATLRGLSSADRLAVDHCADYLLKYRDYLRYDEYLAKGFPISTGVIEGACRYLVKDRMDITGAKWSLAGAEAVLKLRALLASGDFDEYWSFHEAREHDRIHRARYAGMELPAVVLPKRHTSRHLKVMK